MAFIARPPLDKGSICLTAHRQVFYIYEVPYLIATMRLSHLRESSNNWPIGTTFYWSNDQLGLFGYLKRKRYGPIYVEIVWGMALFLHSHPVKNSVSNFIILTLVLWERLCLWYKELDLFGTCDSLLCCNFLLLGICDSACARFSDFYIAQFVSDVISSVFLFWILCVGCVA